MSFVSDQRGAPDRRATSSRSVIGDEESAKDRDAREEALLRRGSRRRELAGKDRS